MEDFLLFLCPEVTAARYRMPLLPGAQFYVTHMFYEQLGKEKGMGYDQVIQLVIFMSRLQ
ncbi:hypothetical protein EON64_15385 [archaeon]|nr:MAG: hypothetical protein EON64_15385 [archaeon]